MKLQDKLLIEILGHKVKVEITSDRNKLLLDNRLCFGISIPREGSITIMKGLTKQEEKFVFYHEVLHYIDWLLHNEEFKYDEETVNVLARGLATIKIIK